MAAGAVAGGLGALLGIGGGVFLVPFLNTVIGLPIKESRGDQPHDRNRDIERRLGQDGRP